MAVMASVDLDQILAQSGVSPTLASEMISDGWTRASFGMCASSASELDQHWEEIFPDQALTFLQKAQLRVAWQTCRDGNASDETPVGDSQAPALTAATMATTGGWSETFAPKLSASAVSATKTKIPQLVSIRDLTQETLPSLRLLSPAHYQLQNKEVRWIPWKFRLSQSRADEVTSGQGAAPAH